MENGISSSGGGGSFRFATSWICFVNSKDQKMVVTFENLLSEFQPKHFQGEHSASRRRSIVKCHEFIRNPAVPSQNATGGRLSATLGLETNSHLSPNPHIIGEKSLRLTVTQFPFAEVSQE